MASTLGDNVKLTRLIVLYIGLIAASLAAGIARPSLAFYLRYELKSSMLAAASLTSGFMLGRALASLIAGFLGEYIPRYRWLVVLLGLIFSGLILSVIIPATRRPSQVIIWMGVWGLISGLIWPSMQVITSELGGSKSGTVLSLYFAIGSLGISMGNWVFGIVDLAVVNLIKYSGCILALSGVLLAGASYGVGAERKYGLKRAVGRVFNPIILWVIFAAFAIGFLSGTLREYFYLYVHEVYGLSREGLGNLLLASGVVSVIGGLVTGVLSDKYGITRILFLVVLFSSLSSFIIGIAPALILLAAGYVGAMLGVRASMPLTRNAAIAGGIGGSLIVGASNTMSSLGMMTGPIVAGYAYEISREYAGLPFVISGLLLLIILILYLIIIRRVDSIRISKF